MEDLEIKVRKAFDEKYPGDIGQQSEFFEKFQPSGVGYAYPEKKKLHQKEVIDTFIGTQAQINKAMDIAKVQDAEDYSLAHDVYMHVDNILNVIFQEKSAITMGMDVNSKLWKLVYAKAWEDGHADGYSNVYSHLDDLVDFANDIIEASKEV